MRKIKRLLKITSLVLLSLVGVISLYLLNTYLEKERLFFYSKGTDKKAFINATWRMSIKEVERANGCQLSGETSFAFLEPELNKLLDIERIERKKSCDINIWGNYRQVTYDFFDDQLFRVNIYDKIFNKVKTDSLVITNLEPRYGKIIRPDDKEFAGNFITEDVKVEYYQYEYNDNKENKMVKNFRLEITYKPLLDEIKCIARKEQQNIF